MNLGFDFSGAGVVNGMRVKQAREQVLMTQGDLAMAAGVSQPMIAHVEQGLKQPSSDLANRIAEATRVRPEFLYRPSSPVLPLGSMLFRARANTSARKLAQTHAIASNIFELFTCMSARFELPSVKLRPVSGTPEEAARETRKMLGVNLGEPIPHLMRAFEKSGGVVLALPELQGREAFAVWAANKPVIAIGPNKSSDRLRFSMAHEIGHLSLHNSPASKALAEKEAHRFAAELLMPSETISRDFAGVLSIEKLGSLKRKWGVSMSALLLRARDIGNLSKRNFGRLIIEMAPFRIKEPTEFDVPLEQPRMLRQMAEILYAPTEEIEKLSSQLAFHEEFVADTLNRYASRQDIAASTRRSKVVPFERGLRVKHETVNYHGNVKLYK